MKKIFRTIILVLIFSFSQVSIFVAKSQGISTVADIYNYEIGDIFHSEWWGTSYSSGFGDWVNIEILDKYYSTNGETLYYTIYYRHLYKDLSGTEYSESIDTLAYTNLNALIEGGNIDTVYSNPDILNGRIINTRIITIGRNWDYESRSYYEGCGGPYKYYYDDDRPWDYVEGGNKLIYYLKGEEEWGNPYYVSIHEPEIKNRTLLIYPSPSRDYISISFGP